MVLDQKPKNSEFFNTGVPQRSIRDAALFLLFINPLMKILWWCYSSLNVLGFEYMATAWVDFFIKIWDQELFKKIPEIVYLDYQWGEKKGEFNLKKKKYILVYNFWIDYFGLDSLVNFKFLTFSLSFVSSSAFIISIVYMFNCHLTW